MTDSTEYRKALRQEKDREREWRKTEQGTFEAGFLHVDYGQLESIEMKYQTSWISDGGEAVEQMIDEIDGVTPTTHYNRCKHTALNRLRRSMPDAVKVMLLIFKNGSNRKESIECLKREMLAKSRTRRPRRRRNITHSEKNC